MTPRTPIMSSVQEHPGSQLYSNLDLLRRRKVTELQIGPSNSTMNVGMNFFEVFSLMHLRTAHHLGQQVGPMKN